MFSKNCSIVEEQKHREGQNEALEISKVVPFNKIINSRKSHV